jgi:hypothetical protein
MIIPKNDSIPGTSKERTALTSMKEIGARSWLFPMGVLVVGAGESKRMHRIRTDQVTNETAT